MKQCVKGKYFFVKMRIFFSTPLAKQKKARYNMTRRTKAVIFQGGCDLGFYRLRD